ncbi:MAG: hypothetical protein QY331_04325 [Melioribacteraceae bacterium]|nr:MAG: hypothetical protein QY331_04325 [Melioribacteraceae bacterium]
MTSVACTNSGSYEKFHFDCTGESLVGQKQRDSFIEVSLSEFLNYPTSEKNEPVHDMEMTRYSETTATFGGSKEFIDKTHMAQNVKFIEGELQRIDNNFALIAFTENDRIIERLVKVERLNHLGDVYEGMKIRLRVEKNNGELRTKFIRFDSDQKNNWENPDESFLKIIRELKKK